MGIFDRLFGKKKINKHENHKKEENKSHEEEENERYEKYLEKTFGEKKKNTNQFSHPPSKSTNMSRITKSNLTFLDKKVNTKITEKKKSKSKLIVSSDDLVNLNGLCYLKKVNNPFYLKEDLFTGIYYKKWINGNLVFETEMLNGEDHGISKKYKYKEDGSIFTIVNYTHGKINDEDKEKESKFHEYITTELPSQIEKTETSKNINVEGLTKDNHQESGDLISKKEEKLIVSEDGDNFDMKINISELCLKEITFSDLLGWFDEEEIEEIKKEILEDGSSYWSEDKFIDFEKEDDSDTIKGTLSTGSFEIIDLINEMKICQEDPFIMIVKDSWYGENSDGDSVGYTSFENLGGGGEEPPTLKGGEYDKKSFMNEGEMNEFYELSENEDIGFDVKYQDFFFIRHSKYKVKEWVEQWLSQDYGHNS